VIEVQHVTHWFGPRGVGLPILRDVDLAVPPASFVSILGPSGCGKTTLLRIMDGLLQPTDGQVLIDDRRVTGPSPERAMVFQEFRLLPWRTAQANVEFGLEVQGSGARRAEIATGALRRVGLASFANHFPHQLSGGMQQRIGLARALATSPRYLLMDEPFGSLDLHPRELLQVEFIRWWEADPMTVVFVTHSVDEAVFLSDRVYVLGARPGHVVYTLDVDLPRPRWTDDQALRASERFLEYRQRLWQVLRVQVGEVSAW
jgi:ABC-type nitrate/sulfonate/bicarbonate transport system ATPase subunit